MKDFCETYALENLITEATCFKSTERPSCIDVMLTNRKLSFHNSTTLETGLSDFHAMTVSVLKVFYKKKGPLKVNYRSFKNFNELNFRNELKKSLEKLSSQLKSKFKSQLTILKVS